MRRTLASAANSYPSYRGADPPARVQATVDRAAGTAYANLLSAHEQDYRALFDRKWTLP